MTDDDALTDLKKRYLALASASELSLREVYDDFEKLLWYCEQHLSRTALPPHLEAIIRDCDMVPRFNPRAVPAEEIEFVKGMFLNAQLKLSLVIDFYATLDKDT